VSNNRLTKQRQKKKADGNARRRKRRKNEKRPLINDTCPNISADMVRTFFSKRNSCRYHSNIMTDPFHPSFLSHSFPTSDVASTQRSYGEQNPELLDDYYQNLPPSISECTCGCRSETSIFRDWLRINHNTVIIVDSKTRQARYIVRCTTFAELKKDKKKYRDLQWLMRYFVRASKSLNKIRLNGAYRRAGGKGSCYGFGYRVGFEKNFYLG